jgi:LysM repeat protein
MMWDKDTDGSHPTGHMEMHPLAAIEFGVTASAPATAETPVLTATPTSLSFGNQLIRQASTPQTILLVNAGSRPQSVNGAAVTGPNAADFAATTNCVPSMAAGSSCTITVSFTPSIAGEEHASVELAAPIPGAPTRTFAVSGVGVTTFTGVDRPGPAYEVLRGDSLAKIAERFYGKQHWPPVFCSNRKSVRNPDLIFPGQKLMVPVTAEELRQATCRVPRSVRQ